MADWKQTKCCATCALYPVEEVKDAGGRLRKDRVAKCRWKSVEAWPTASRGHGFLRPTGGYITPLDGVECPCYAKRGDVHQPFHSEKP